MNLFKNMSQNSAYVLGYLTGDGGLRYIKNNWHMYITSKDIENLEWIASLFGKKNLQYINKGKHNEARRLDIRDRELGEYLKEYGYDKKYLQPTKPFVDLEKEYKWSYIHGLYDSDGTCCVSLIESKTYKLVHVNKRVKLMCYENLAKEISKFLDSEGIKNSLLFKQHTSKGYDLFKVEVWNEDLSKFIENIYRNQVGIERKKKVFDIKEYISDEEAALLGYNIQRKRRKHKIYSRKYKYGMLYWITVDGYYESFKSLEEAESKQEEIIRIGTERILNTQEYKVPEYRTVC